MYIMNGIVYAGNLSSELKIQTVKPLDDMMMIITFTSGEKRLFDATTLLSMPAFKILENDTLFKKAEVEHGVVIWNNGDIDIAPEYVYKNSFLYDEIFTL